MKDIAVVKIRNVVQILKEHNVGRPEFYASIVSLQDEAICSSCGMTFDSVCVIFCGGVYHINCFNNINLRKRSKLHICQLCNKPYASLSRNSFKAVIKDKRNVYTYIHKSCYNKIKKIVNEQIEINQDWIIAANI